MNFYEMVSIAYFTRLSVPTMGMGGLVKGLGGGTVFRLKLGMGILGPGWA